MGFNSFDRVKPKVWSLVREGEGSPLASSTEPATMSRPGSYGYIGWLGHGIARCFQDARATKPATNRTSQASPGKTAARS